MGVDEEGMSPAKFCKFNDGQKVITGYGEVEGVMGMDETGMSAAKFCKLNDGRKMITRYG